MRKLLMITTVLCGVWAGPGSKPAEAAPVVTLVNVAWIKAGAALTGVFGATIGQALLQLGASIVLSRVAMALRGKPKQQELLRELQQPTSLPAYRFVYGKCMAPGTPAPVRVKGAILYGCFILNSRPSAGPFTVYLDKRAVEVSGDPYDFAGAGATATNAPFAGYCKYWIGRGDQVGPPAEILSEAPDLFLPTDGWQGLTVIWFRLDRGPNESRQERWPATPPEVLVDGRWSLVWDPRDALQDPDDASTWAWSANHGLCVLDALRMNPVRGYDLRYLWQETFEWAADVADETVAVVGGGTIPRYEVNGVLVFDRGAELEDQVLPMAQAGAARFTRVGGRLGLVPGVYSAPVMTLTDVLDDAPLAFTRYRPSNELVTAVTATYSNPDRFYEDASTPVYTIAGAQAADGGIERLGQYDLRFVTDHRQAQRVAKILGMRTRMQKTVSGVFPPAAFDLIGGSPVTLALPAPYAHRNGVYEVEEASPALDVVGLDGVALRMPLSMRETSSAVYAWSTADEQPIAEEVYDGAIDPPEAPTDLQAAQSVAGFTYQVNFDFIPSVTATVLSYEWQWQNEYLGVWNIGGTLNPDNVTGGRIYGVLSGIASGTYSIRVRAIGATGASDWLTLTGILVDDEIVIDAGTGP